MDVQNQSYGYDNAAAFSRYWRTDVRTVSRLTIFLDLWVTRFDYQVWGRAGPSFIYVAKK